MSALTWLRRPFTLALAVGGVLALLLGLRLSRRPRRYRHGITWRTRALARRLFTAYGANGVSYFTTVGNTALWADPCRRGVVGYRVIGGTALVIGDPLAAPAHQGAVLTGFLAHCRLHGWSPAFYQTLRTALPHYRNHGLRAFAIGSEAIIDLPSFTLRGKRIANVRHSVTHAERAGLQVRFYETHTLTNAVRADLRSISDEWLATKGGAEMGFTMGRLSADGRPGWGTWVAVAYDAGGRAQAFITLVPAGGERGRMLDLMRRRRDVESGTMDLLIARAAEALRDEGLATLSLSLAPLASVDDVDEDAPAVARGARDLLYEKMSGAYNYRSLFKYKDKFAVQWETRYLVYAGDMALPSALYATIRAHLQSPVGMLQRLPSIMRSRGERSSPARRAA